MKLSFLIHSLPYFLYYVSCKLIKCFAVVDLTNVLKRYRHEKAKLTHLDIKAYITQLDSKNLEEKKYMFLQNS